MRRAPVVLASLCLLTAIARAGEGESALSPSVGWATYETTDPHGKAISSTLGAAVGATYEHGISEALSWRVSLLGAAFTGDEGQTGVLVGAAGIVYRFDVLKYVPYVEISVAGCVVGGKPIATGIDPMLELGGGLDILTSRDRSWGIEARLGTFPDDTTIFTIGVRTTWRWGYF